MWYRRILKHTCVVETTNEDILKRDDEISTLWNMLKRRQNVQIGHILRHEPLLKTVIEGQDRRGRPREEYIQ